MDASKGSRKAVLLVLLVFVLGIALGGVSVYLLTSRVHAARTQPAGRKKVHTVAMFTRDLNLNADQEKQIEKILSDTRARYAALHDRLDPEYEQVRQEGRERIRQVLTPEQRPKFEELLRQMDKDRPRRQTGQRR
jgi:Spy/CpxP family protein refolding chaperone